MNVPCACVVEMIQIKNEKNTRQKKLATHQVACLMDLLDEEGRGREAKNVVRIDHNKKVSSSFFNGS